MEKYYDILGLSVGASLKDVKKTARRLFIENHPDMHRENKEHFERKIKTLIEAYKMVLQDKCAAGETGDEAPAEDRAGENAETFEALLIKLANRTLALPMRHIREVIRVGDVRIDDAGLMADTFPFLAGIFHRRNEIALLWNLHSQLGLRDMQINSNLAKNKIVVVDWDDSAVGLLVDDVGGFVVLRNDSVVAPETSAGFEDLFLDGIIDTEEGPVKLLDLNKILYNLPV